MTLISIIKEVRDIETNVTITAIKKQNPNVKMMQISEMIYIFE